MLRKARPPCCSGCRVLGSKRAAIKFEPIGMTDELLMHNSPDFKVSKDLGYKHLRFPPNHYTSEIKYDVHNCYTLKANFPGAIFS